MRQIESTIKPGGSAPARALGGSLILKNYQLYLLMLPGLIYLIVFRYFPMYGVQIAFKKFVPAAGIAGSEWVGFRHFVTFFNSYQFLRVLNNTIALSVLQLAISFPLPIVLALMLNQARWPRFKKVSQTVVYAPHFISTVVLVSMISVFFSLRTGLVNNVIAMLGGARIDFLAEPSYFRPLYILSGIWQSTGYGSVIFLAALANVSPDLHEAAVVDGASKLQRILHIDIPAIMPTAIILLIINTGRMMSIGFEKAFLMQNARNFSTSEIISTYVYKVGLLRVQYDYAASIDLFNSVINFLLIIMVNYIANRATESTFGETSLW
jgi:putative aldouronate transport system permease protein